MEKLRLVFGALAVSLFLGSTGFAAESEERVIVRKSEQEGFSQAIFSGNSAKTLYDSLTVKEVSGLMSDDAKKAGWESTLKKGTSILCGRLAKKDTPASYYCWSHFNADGLGVPMLEEKKDDKKPLASPELPPTPKP